MTNPTERSAPLDLDPAEFRRLGHDLVDRIAGHLESLSGLPVNPGDTPTEIRTRLGDAGLPETGMDPGKLLGEASDLLFDKSLFNGHPSFFGYITSSGAPIGALGDLLAASINPNLGGFLLSPMACEIELQVVRWIAEFLRMPASTGGLLVSGGNMANLVGFWTARQEKLPKDIRTLGVTALSGSPRAYVSAETHTWVQKAADLSGFGTDSVRWIPTDSGLRMDPEALRENIARDKAAGDLPFLVVANAGTVSTGAVDPIREIAAICREHDLWLHVDGAYGAPAAVLNHVPEDLHHLGLADSLAVDPHKWLYTPLEAGCVLVRDREALRRTFSYRPDYYPADDTRGGDPGIFFHEFGPQNSRGFRALKVWLAFRQVGRSGYARMIGEDIALAEYLHELAGREPELEPVAQGLSISAFRFVPGDIDADAQAEYLDELNRVLVERLQISGEAFVSNAVVGGRYLLRACVVNFRTDRAAMEHLVATVIRHGRDLDAELRPQGDPH